MKFFPNITTTKGSNWREKIREINSLKIEEVALFPTVLNKDERKTLYSLIKNSTIKKIPFVHLRDDMDISELDFLVNEYDTRIFNTHSLREFPVNKDWILKYRELICIENNYNYPLDPEEINKFGGICLDFAHLENVRILEPERYEKEIKVLNSFPVKCNHISAIKKEFSFVDEKKRKLQYDSHHLEDLSELDYLKNYPVKYFSEFCAIELENKISEQIEAIDYIKNFMGARDSFINNMLKY
jgi:hypothetical protein